MKNETSSGQECSCIPSRWKVGVVWGKEGGREWGADLSSEVVKQTGKVRRGLEWEGVEIQVEQHRLTKRNALRRPKGK